ncbi:MAG TPA: hypothetical protein VNO23_18105, partial [Candidatus Binatia bacterium]|nr:hypothetical protein [Candidatus Binatia bacterium]
ARSHQTAGAPEDSGPAEAAESGDLALLWQRVVDDVMAKKPMLGAVLAQARPLGLAGGALSVVVGGNHFHRDMLADRASRELLQAAVRRQVPGAERVDLVEGGAPGGDLREHPVVQAVIEGLEGEVVAVRPRPPEGDGQ